MGLGFSLKKSCDNCPAAFTVVNTVKIAVYSTVLFMSGESYLIDGKKIKLVVIDNGTTRPGPYDLVSRSSALLGGQIR